MSNANVAQDSAWNSQAGKVIAADSLSWTIQHTGSGCYAWSAPCGAHAEVMLTDDDGGLGDDGKALHWLVWRQYPTSGLASPAIQSATLTEALRVAREEAEEQRAADARAERIAAFEAQAFASPIGRAFKADSLPWHIQHTGGGCLAWSTPCDAMADIYITDDGGTGLGLDDDGTEWLVGLQPLVGHNGDAPCFAYPTLTEALAAATAMAGARAFALGFRSGLWLDSMAAQDGAAANVAIAFYTVLGEWLDRSEMRTVRERNVKHADSNICASHDFCDANMAMDEAFRRVFGAGPLDGVDQMSDAACNLWGAAWDMAKRDYLTDRLPRVS
jgi:hypothetical protein